MSITNELSFKDNLLIGGIARATAVSALYPIDTIKTRLQSNIKFKEAIKNHYTMVILLQ